MNKSPRGSSRHRWLVMMPSRAMPWRIAISTSNWYCGSRVRGWPAAVRVSMRCSSWRFEVNELVIPGVPGLFEQPGPRLGPQERLARQRPALEVEQLLRRAEALDHQIPVPPDALHL